MSACHQEQVSAGRQGQQDSVLGQSPTGQMAGTLPSARLKIGLNANRPIDPKTGRIEPQVADPEIIASTGAGWVRLNFVLGPWSGPDDDTPYHGSSWAKTYSQIIAGFRRRGLQIYGLIGVEAMPAGPGDRFRSPPPNGDARDGWLDRYVDQFQAIVERFHEEVPVFESFNEPDDWHGQDRNWIHPDWFAVMLQRLYSAIRSRPQLAHVRLVSGPLQGLEANRNAAVTYLQRTYRTGKAWFGWGQPGVPFPFDGIGYHLYVKEAFVSDLAQHEHAVRAACRRYLDGVKQVIRQQEGSDRSLYVSEMGWNSRVEDQEVRRREAFQATSLRAGLETLIADPQVAAGFWFCAQDFGTATQPIYFGLYRPGQAGPASRKPAFNTFKALCDGRLEEEDDGNARPRYTNQQVISAFYAAAAYLELSPRWGLLDKAGLRLSSLAADRQGIYEGRPIEQLPKLTDAERALIQAYLDGQEPAARVAPTADEAPPGAAAAPIETAAIDAPIDLLAALQAGTFEEIERLGRVLAQSLQEIRQGQATSRRRLSWPAIALAVLLATMVISALTSLTVLWLLG